MNPRDVEKARIQEEITEKWQCTNPTCASRFCYILKDHGGIHVPLNAPEYSVWVEAIVSSYTWPSRTVR